jgi:ABC-type transport system involved in multi-copper enzyme maturation permease subunit
MTLYQAELKYYLRSAIIWVIMALVAFFSAWSFLFSIELFSTLQVKFSSMADAPTIIQGIVIPVIAAQAKILIILVSIIAGLSFSRLAHNQNWSLLSSFQLSEWQIIGQKWLAVITVLALFLLPALLAIMSLVWMAHLPLLPIVMAYLGLLLLLIWMVSLALLLSSWVNNTGFAILLCLMVFASLLLLSQSTTHSVWGKNWIQVFSPYYHFQQFFADYLPMSSLFYFVSGALISLFALRIRLLQKRMTL